MRLLALVPKMAYATMCRTKAGKGLKLCVNGVWMYTSFPEFSKMINGKANGCIFRTISGAQFKGGSVAQ